MKFECWGIEIQVRRLGRRCWEVQDSDECGHLVWYSGEPYMSRVEAVTRARFRELPAGWRRVVRNVRTGERADFGRPSTQHETGHETAQHGL